MTPLNVAAALEKHKYILTGAPGETVDQLWARASQFTARVCRDVRDQYALIRKAGGRRCECITRIDDKGTPKDVHEFIDCDKIIDRATLQIYDLVASGGAPNATAQFADAGATGTHADMVEPPPYEGDGKPTPVPGIPAPPVAPWTLPGREEMMVAGKRLHEFYKSNDGLQRPSGLWRDDTGQPDWEGIAAWLFDLYLSNRVGGKTADESFAIVIKEIRHSEEWLAKHPGEKP